MGNGVNMSCVHSIVYNEFNDSRGSLRVIDDRGLLFKIKRVFWIYDVPPGEIRGRHAHRDCEQVLFCVSGRFCVRLDGRQYTLFPDSPPVYVPTRAYIELFAFSVGAVCLVLCSEYYNEDEVIKNG